MPVSRHTSSGASRVHRGSSSGLGGGPRHAGGQARDSYHYGAGRNYAGGKGGSNGSHGRGRGSGTGQPRFGDAQRGRQLQQHRSGLAAQFPHAIHPRRGTWCESLGVKIEQRYTGKDWTKTSAILLFVLLVRASLE